MGILMTKKIMALISLLATFTFIYTYADTDGNKAQKDLLKSSTQTLPQLIKTLEAELNQNGLGYEGIRNKEALNSILKMPEKSIIEINKRLASGKKSSREVELLLNLVSYMDNDLSIPFFKGQLKKASIKKPQDITHLSRLIMNLGKTKDKKLYPYFTQLIKKNPNLLDEEKTFYSIIDALALTDKKKALSYLKSLCQSRKNDPNIFYLELKLRELQE
jgi:hypothetical protein